MTGWGAPASSDDARHPETGIVQTHGQLGHQGLGPQGEIDEAGTCDFGGEAEVREGGIRPQGLADGGGDLPGGLLQRFGQGQGTVGLEVAEFGPGGRRQLGIEGLARLPGGLGGLREGALHGGRQPGLERTEDRQHGEIRRVVAGMVEVLIMPLHPLQALALPSGSGEGMAEALRKLRLDGSWLLN